MQNIDSFQMNLLIDIYQILNKNYNLNNIDRKKGEYNRIKRGQLLKEAKL